MSVILPSPEMLEGLEQGHHTRFRKDPRSEDPHWRELQPENGE